MAKFNPEQQRRVDDRRVELINDKSWDRGVLAGRVASLEEQLREARDQRALAVEQLDSVTAEKDKLHEQLRHYEKDLVPRLEELQAMLGVKP